MQQSFKRFATAALAMVCFASSSLCSFADDGIVPEKKAEILRMLQLTGTQKLMEQMKTQMITGLRTQLKGVPDEFWVRFQQKMNMDELLQKLIPLYDKYYSLEDLRAVNAFYASDVGRRVLETLPKISRESTAIGMEWGKRIGEEAEREVREELKQKESAK